MISCSAIQRATSTGNSVASGRSSETDAPAAAAAKRSRIERSKCSGAWLESRSCSVIANSSAAQRTNVIALRCESITPFGSPVDPDV